MVDEVLVAGQSVFIVIKLFSSRSSTFGVNKLECLILAKKFPKLRLHRQIVIVENASYQLLVRHENTLHCSKSKGL